MYPFKQNRIKATKYSLCLSWWSSLFCSLSLCHLLSHNRPPSPARSPLLRIMWQSAPVPMVTVTFLGNAIVGLLSLSISLITFPPYFLLSFAFSLSPSLFLVQSLNLLSHPLSHSQFPQLSLSFYFPLSFSLTPTIIFSPLLLSASHGSCWIIDLMKYLAVILLDCWALRLWSNVGPETQWVHQASVPSQSPPPNHLSSGDHAHPEQPT